jgi:hypothetical protein
VIQDDDGRLNPSLRPSAGCRGCAQASGRRARAASTARC